MRRAAVALVAIALLLPAGAASAAKLVPAPGPQSLTGTTGPTSATLTYTNPREPYSGITDAHLSITRAGVTGFNGALTDLCGMRCLLGVDPGLPPLEVIDLDADGEPEVLVNANSGGAHCCTSLAMYSYQPASGTDTDVVYQLGDQSYRLQDVDGNGSTEIVTLDDSFAYAFTSYAASTYPPLILADQGGRFVNITRSQPSLIAANAASQLRILRAAKHSRYTDRRGVLAAYVADETLLGTPNKGLALIAPLMKRGLLGRHRDGWPSGAKYRPALLRFLTAHGYTS